MGEASYGVPAILAVTLVTAYMLHYFAASECDLAVRFMVMVSWTLSLSIVALVPADVAATLYDEETSSLSTLWDLSYWITFTLTWFVLPFHQLYEDAGDFSALARASTSLRENGIFYGVIVFILLLGAILLTSYGAMTSESMATFALASSTIFGICAGIFALGFGLVDVPKIIWRRADVAKRQAEAHRRLGVASRALEDAFVGLRKVIKASETTREVIPRHHVYAWAVAVIARETPKSSAFEGAMDKVEDDVDGVLDYDYDELSDLVTLRRELRRRTRVYRRTAAQYAVAVENAIEAEAVFNCGAGAGGLGDRGCLMTPDGGQRRFRSPLRAPRQGRYGEAVETVEWWWKCRVEPVLLRVLAVALGAFSVLTVWAEGTMFSTQAMEGADVSPFSAMVRAAKDKGGLHMAVAIPLGYMCWCAYHSLFRLGMFSFYALVPGHTDSFSLLINAALTCRFAAPLSLNFLMMVPSLREGDANKETTFGRKFVDGVPDSARNFAAVFPAILVFYCGALAFGVFDKIFSACTSSFGGSLRDKYKFESDEKDLERNVHTTDGKRIAERERSAMQNQTKPKIGSGSPYYFELASGDMGRESEMADLGGNRAADVDVERAGLLSAGGRRSQPRSDERPESRWERNKERLASALERTGELRVAKPPGAKPPGSSSRASRFGLGRGFGVGSGGTDSSTGGGSRLDSMFASLGGDK